VLKLPASWLLRLRHNPFYDYQQRRVLDWIDRASQPSSSAGADQQGRRTPPIRTSFAVSG
jgi:hypothetical protein